MKTLIYGGTVIDPSNRVFSKLNVLIEDGKITEVSKRMPEADRKINAEGKIVCPGFVDIHMHEDPVGGDGRIVLDDKTAIFNCSLRQGVTTAIGGNCGINLYDPGDYLDIVDKFGTPVNVGMFAGHAYFREQNGGSDKYAPVSDEIKEKMAAGIARALERGCVGVSYGIRYVPGIDRDEMLKTAAPCKKGSRLIAAHIRSDAEEVYAAAEELLETGKALGIPTQVSHIGSMAGFGQMEKFLNMVDEYKMGGLDVCCDCYPYYAFSTHLGSTTYDDGWLDRYGCDYSVVELCEGKYKGQRCTKEIFDEVRRDDPMCITVCHVMKESDVDMAFSHPAVMLGSDGIFNAGQGHPRAAGAFPRFISEFVRTGKVGLYNAIDMMTSMPARRLGIEKGTLSVGSDADIVVFDYEKIRDRATFSEPALPPKGIDYVIIAGEIAAENGEVLRYDLGKSIRK